MCSNPRRTDKHEDVGPRDGGNVPLIFEYLCYFLFGFTRHLILLGVLCLTGAIVCARLGRSLGIDRLFWHEHRPTQFGAGAATGLLFAKVGFVGYLLDEDLLRALPLFASAAPNERALAAALYIALLSAPTALIWLTLALVARRPTRSSTAVPRLPFLIGAGASLALSFALLATFARLVPADPSLPSWLVKLLVLEDAPRSARPLHLLAGVFMLLLSTEYATYALTRHGFTPAVAICTLLGLVAGSTGFLEFRAWNESAVVLALLLATFVGGLPSYKLRIRALRGRYAAPVALARYMAAAEPCAYQLVRSEEIPWRAGGHKRPLVLVCASGGGLRAALWTAEVLSELELALPGFAPSLRMIAGASGGMVGGAHYALSLGAKGEGEGGWAHALSREELIERLGQDSLSTPIKRLVLRDLPFASLPFANTNDRGDALESCWRALFGAGFDSCFGDLVERERKGDLPSLVFTPMLVEDGRRLLISNLDLSFVCENEVPAGAGARLLSRSGFELARLFPEEFASFPVRTAARLSAAFPYVSPAVSLPTDPRRRVVDAGYYDNYGVNVCAAWLSDCFCNRARRRWIEDNVSHILVVQIRDFVSPLQGVSAPARRGHRPLARGLEGLFSPLHGLLSSRESVSVFRNDEQLEQVMQLYDAGLRQGFLRTEIFEYPGEASLSWYLTRAERAAISKSARELRGQFADLSRWWRGEEPGARASTGVHIATLPYGDWPNER